jgi:hypothetical protein
LGAITVGVAAPKQTITVTATNALTDLLVTPSGANVSIDKNASTCVQTLAAGASCIVVVNFTATTNGAKSDAIVIAAGGSSGKTVTVPVTATAQLPAKLVINPSTTQDFATPVGVPSSAISFGVANAGDLATGSITVAVTGANAADFTATSSCTLLSSLNNCSVSVVFTPKVFSVAKENATLVVTDTGTGATSVQVALTGTTFQTPTLAITPAAADLGQVMVGATGATSIFTVTNSGDTATGPISIGISSTEFTITNDTCNGASLAKAGTCTIAIALKPLTPGAKSATLTVTPTVGNQLGKTITGTAITKAGLTASPPSLDFGNIRINKTGTAQTVTFTNQGGTATGALTMNKAGAFGDFPVTASTCSAALAPAGTCTVTVNFAPTEVGSKTASISVTDGTTTATVPLLGNAQDSTGITISPNPVPACTATRLTDCFNDTVINGSSNTITFTVKAEDTLPAGVDDTGAITATMAGPNAADFTIASNNCTSLLRKATCSIAVVFAPSAIGQRQATLNVVTVNGGSDAATLQAVGLAILEIRPVVTAQEIAAGTTGLDFGQVPLLASPDPNDINDYQIIVRGPNSATVHTTTVVTTLTDPSQPADFSFPYEGRTNPCNGPTNDGVALNFAASPIVAPTNWNYDTATKTFTCTFNVKFYPQSSKGNKTATLAASGTGGGSDSKTLTGVASGALTFTPSTFTFDNIQVGDSTNTQNVTMVTVIDISDNAVFSLKNNSATTDLGPLAITLAGTNADQFWIVKDYCSTGTLAHGGTTCDIVVAFMPTSIGAKTAILRATAGTVEVAEATLNGGGTVPIKITVTPASYEFLTTVQTVPSAWVTFTVTNPAGATKSAQIEYYSTGSYFEVANGVNHERGTCGISGYTALAANQSCTILARFIPGIGNGFTDASEGHLIVSDRSKDDTVDVKMTGKASSRLTITAPTTYTFPDTARGRTSLPYTFVINNLGTTAATLSIPANGTYPSFNIDMTTGCGSAATIAAGGNCNLVVRFTAAQTLGEVTSDILIHDSTPDSNASVTAKVKGKSVKPAELIALGVTYNHTTPTWPANTIHMGSVRQDSQSGNLTIYYKNVGSVATGPLQYVWADGTTGTAAAANTPDSQFTIVNESTAGCVGKSALAADATCSVTFYFAPAAASLAGTTFSKRFTLSSANGGIAAAYTLSATVLSQDESLWAASSSGSNAFLAFPTLTAVNANATQVFQVTNATATAIPVNDVTFTVTSAIADWSLLFTADAAGSTRCVTSIAANSSCTFAVRFAPTAFTDVTAYRWATVNIGGGNYPASTVGVFGRVQSPAAFTISTVDDGAFGQVVVGGSTTKAFTVTNTGETASAPVAAAITFGGTYFSVDSNCSAALAPNGTCTGTITGQPGTSLVEQAGVLTVSATGTTSATQALSLIGVIDTALALSASTLTFPAAAATTTQVGTVSETLTITLTNLANTRTSGVVAVALADTTNFAIVDNTCADKTTGLVSLDTCKVSLYFKPQTLPANGTFTTTLTFTASPGGTKTVNITGKASSGLTITPSGPVTVGVSGGVPVMQQFVVAYTGETPTAALVTTLTGDNYIIRQDQCVTTQLSAGDSCQIWVQLKTGVAATPQKTGTLTVNGGSAGATASVALVSVAGS